MMRKIDYHSYVPLYHQLYEILHEKITDNVWKQGEMSPSESELIRIYDVSRITVRKVFDILVKEGLVYRKQGKGSFVAHTSLEHGLTRIISFTEDMASRGFKSSTRILFAGLVQANTYIAEKLNVFPGKELVQLERLRLADEEPMCLEKSFLIHKYVPDILNYNLSENSLYEILTNRYNLKWVKASQIIRAINAPPDIAKNLGIKKNKALLYFERVSFISGNIPIEFLYAYYRADRYTLFNELQGSTA